MEQSYKEKYERALAKAKEQYNYPCMRSCMGILEEIFPELAESDGEKVREELIKHLKEGAEGYEPAGGSSDYQRWLAWLEKQGEQKFEMKTAEESLGIDSDTYNKIVDECIFGEQKAEENKGNIGGISPNWSEEDECYMTECINAIATKDSWSFEEKIKTKHWVKSLKQRIGG